MKSSRTLGVRQRAATSCSPPVNSVVSPKTRVTPCGYSLSKALPTQGFAPIPEVVSDSPHFVDTHRSFSGRSSRVCSLAHCTYSFAAFDARMMVSWSPCCSMPKYDTGLPVLAMPSATLFAQPGSMQITTTAATLGLGEEGRRRHRQDRQAR